MCSSDLKRSAFRLVSLQFRETVNKKFRFVSLSFALKVSRNWKAKISLQFRFVLVIVSLCFALFRFVIPTLSDVKGEKMSRGSNVQGTND